MITKTLFFTNSIYKYSELNCTWLTIYRAEVKLKLLKVLMAQGKLVMCTTRLNLQASYLIQSVFDDQVLTVTNIILLTNSQWATDLIIEYL